MVTSPFQVPFYFISKMLKRDAQEQYLEHQDQAFDGGNDFLDSSLSFRGDIKLLKKPR